MSGSRIRGITVEIGGDTVGLQNALKDVNKRSNDLQRELKDVDKLLRFNPGNVELLAQKQQLLTERIEATSQKLTQLRAAQSQVQAQFERGEIGAEQYRAFRREIETTEGSLNGLQNQLQNMANEQQQVAQSTRQLEALFEATGTSVDQFADLLGSRLTASIRNGTATSAQLEEAIDKIGRESVGSGEDLNRLRQALADLGNGTSIDSVVNEIRRISQQADLSRGLLGDMGIGLESALQGVNQRSKELQNELKEVDKLLRFDPGNVEALAQKQQLLSESVANTTEKLNQLRAAEQQVQAQFASGSISQEQYRAFRREIEQAEASINQFESALQEMAQEQQRVESSTRQLSTLFDATGTSIDQFADTLGNQLTSAIRNGTASSSQLEEAIQRIGR
ncbi:hypothetical protein ABET51_02710 [Metabacillus fastidiosus]|uniref:hypothetical protein n=1 Tax=Metabacillus fastidiosus TaxID=1458 RepID=UPI003D2E83AA